MASDAGAADLARFFRDHQRIVAVTGAGCSTGSGIPAYRDAEGNWKHARPVLFPDFIRSSDVRRRYWARSTLGWPRFATAVPNAAHQGLAALEARGLLSGIVTQNVDRLHQRAGSQAVVDLHGRLDVVRCLGCNLHLPRPEWQAELCRLNAAWTEQAAQAAPDGDAVPEAADDSGFQVPGCPVCGGIMKPDVVFYGEAVPEEVGTAARLTVDAADALLVVGSSLMVYSGFRLVRDSAAAGKRVAAINLGRTRADELLALHWRQDCASAIQALVGLLDA